MATSQLTTEKLKRWNSFVINTFECMLDDWECTDKFAYSKISNMLREFIEFTQVKYFDSALIFTARLMYVQSERTVNRGVECIHLTYSKEDMIKFCEYLLTVLK
jgi:hypothetical protein